MLLCLRTEVLKGGNFPPLFLRRRSLKRAQMERCGSDLDRLHVLEATGRAGGEDETGMASPGRARLRGVRRSRIFQRPRTGSVPLCLPGDLQLRLKTRRLRFSTPKVRLTFAVSRLRYGSRDQPSRYRIPRTQYPHEIEPESRQNVTDSLTRSKVKCHKRSV